MESRATDVGIRTHIELQFCTSIIIPKTSHLTVIVSLISLIVLFYLTLRPSAKRPEGGPRCARQARQRLASSIPCTHSAPSTGQLNLNLYNDSG